MHGVTMMFMYVKDWFSLIFPLFPIGLLRK